MRKLVVALAAVSAIALGACQSNEAAQVENEAEAQSDLIEAQAEALPEGAARDAAEAQAEHVERVGEARADAIDNGAVHNTDTSVNTVTAPPAVN